MHEAFMARAVQLAQRGLYTTRPNPRVGCVLVKDGAIVAEGWHQRAGEAHAEINTLQQLANSDDNIEAKACTAYVTLEPCSHTGKTGPCADALINAGIKTLVYGMQDPNPQVAGQGLQKLRDAGIEVIGPILEEECQQLNPGFIKRMQTGLPYVRIKMAGSLDGRSAMTGGESQWITGPAAREDVQQLRARSCAIVTGTGTVVADNPSLNVRSKNLPPLARELQPLRVIVGNSDIGNDSAIFQTPGEVMQHKSHDLQALLQLLAEKQCNEVLVEAGATLAGAFIQQKLADEIVYYMAPCLMGSAARPVFELPINSMGDKIELQIRDCRAVGSDWRFSLEPRY